MTLTMPRTLVVLPSYNEKDNIVALIEALLALGVNYSVCVVDDSSPDGTSTIVKNAIATKKLEDRVHLITRTKKDGRGGAVRTGLRWGRDSGKGFEAYIEMDCDFSHEPKAIATGLALLATGGDVALGCRYPDGKIEGWPLSRYILSFCANLLARLLIDWSIPDYTNGFRFYSPRALDVLLRLEQKHEGYIYLSESLSQLLRSKMKILTFPIYFRNRVRGESNTNFAEVSNAFLGIFSIAWEHHFKPLTKIES